MLDRQYCYFCFIDEIGLCDICIGDLVELDLCLYCVVSGQVCNACKYKEQQAEQNLISILDWIEKNDLYFHNKMIWNYNIHQHQQQ